MAIRFEPNKGATDLPQKPATQRPPLPPTNSEDTAPAEAELPFAKPVRPEKKRKPK